METKRDTKGGMIPYVFLIMGCLSMHSESGFVEFLRTNPKHEPNFTQTTSKVNTTR
jgi:hypothetical protein